MLDVYEANLTPYDPAPECGLVDIVYEMTGKIFVIEDVLWN